MTDKRRAIEVEKIDKLLEKHIFVGKINDKLTMDVSVRTSIAEALVDAGFGSAERFEIEQRSWSRIFDIKLIQYPTEKEE